jgi:hypothetical protein
LLITFTATVTVSLSFGASLPSVTITFSVYSKLSPTGTGPDAERLVSMLSSTSDLVTVKAASKAGVPNLRRRDHAPRRRVEYGIRYWIVRRLPLRSVPKGYRLAAVAEEEPESGSEIWRNVNRLPDTVMSAKENTLALKRAVIFGPLPAAG